MVFQVESGDGGWTSEETILNMFEFGGSNLIEYYSD